MNACLLIVTICLLLSGHRQIVGFLRNNMILHDEVVVHDVSPIRHSLNRLEMPYELHFNLVRKHKRNTRLRLEKWEYTDKTFLVYHLLNGKLLPTTRQNTTSKTNLYVDPGKNALLLVTAGVKGKFANFSLHGSFWEAGTQYEITSSVRNERIAHTLKKIESPTYESDIFYPPTNILCPVQSTRKVRRVHRQSEARHYIELAIITDYPVYCRFLELANNNTDLAESEMADYYRFVTASIDKRYQTITEHFPMLNVRVFLSSLTICNEPTQCLWSTHNVIKGTDKIDYTKALPQFKDFVAGSKHLKGDHKMFITGYRMAKSDGSIGNIGVAYIGTVCTDWAVSVIQDRFSGITAGVAAHELGHSLSAQHDHHKSYIGCSDQHYVMNSHASYPVSDKTASRPYFFSNCSAKSIADYLTGTKGHCTLNYPRFAKVPAVAAGQRFDADAQCVIYSGAGSRFCRAEQKQIGFTNMCTRIFCSHPKNPTVCSEVVPLDRTSCGDRQWCVQGVCVRSAEAPEKAEDCPQGDDPATTCTSDMCTGQGGNATLCCQTCSKKRAQAHHTIRGVKIKSVVLTSKPVIEASGRCNSLCRCTRKYSRSYCSLFSTG